MEVTSPTPAFWRGKKVFLTGHTGFKGAWLSLWLESWGAKVLGYSLSPNSQPSLFEQASIAKKIRSVIADVRSFETVLKEYRAFEPDVVIHMAAQALVRPSYKDPLGTYATNIMGTAHVLEAARQVTSARSVVVVTTDKCYENPENNRAFAETDAMGGFDPYSSSKAGAEIVTSAYRRSFFEGARVASARAGNVVGGGDWSEDRLIPDCMRALAKGEAIPVRNPGSTRPWQHVLEPLSGYLVLAEKVFSDPRRFASAYNFGPRNPDEAKPVSFVADQIVRAWGGGAKWKDVHDSKAPHEAGFLRLDPRKAREELGWQARLDLTQTLEWTVDWYRRMGAGADASAICLEQIQKYLSR